MKTTLHLTAAALVAAGCLSISTAASAATCPTSQTLATFRTTDCTAGDKEYAYLDDDLPATGVDIEIDFFTLPNGKEIHTFSVNPTTPGQFLAGTYNISYTIEVLDPNKWFEAYSIDADVPGGFSGVNFTKVIDDDDNLGNGSVDSLTSLGGPAGPAALPGQLTKLWVYETVTVGPNGAVNSYSDTYTQSTGRAPEPATLALLGLGLAGLGLSRRRKQA